MDKQKGYVEIHRRKSQTNALRSYSLLINNKKIDSINSDQKSRYELVSGRHELRIALDFYKSPPLTIDLRPGETLSLECGDRGTTTLRETLSLKGMTQSLQALTSPSDYLYIKCTGSRLLTADEQSSMTKKPTQRRQNKTSLDNDFGIFVSYRRDDSRAMTGRLCDRLTDHFGHKAVFRDVDSIPLGVDFRTHIRETIAKSEALLVIIGPSWLEIANSKGQRRLSLSDDFVRLEIESALQQNIPVIPVMVDGAEIPSVDQLPESLRVLCYKNALKIPQEPFFHAGVNKLISDLDRLKSSKTQSQDKTRRLYCTGCGTELATTQKFCTACGKSASLTS